MKLNQRLGFPLGSLGAFNLLLGGALLLKCGPGGAGSIQIDSPKARKQKMQTGGGLVPAATAKPGSRETPGKPAPRLKARNPVRNDH
jgi:hypothetical protein